MHHPQSGRVIKLVQFDCYNGESWQRCASFGHTITIDESDAQMLSIQDASGWRHYNPVRYINISELPGGSGK